VKLSEIDLLSIARTAARDPNETRPVRSLIAIAEDISVMVQLPIRSCVGSRSVSQPCARAVTAHWKAP
jgi:hypothetical protein